MLGQITSVALQCIGGAALSVTLLGTIANFLADRERRALAAVDIKGKVVVVTGAGSGIGKAIAEVAHARGAHVVICGRRAAPLRELEGALGGGRGGGGGRTTVVSECDVTKEEDLQRLHAAAVATGLLIAVIVLNAGRSCCGEFDETDATLQNSREMIELNYMANVRLTQLFLPALQKSQGAVLAISSLSGLFPTYRGNAYCGAKHALNGFLDSVRVEQLRRKVSVTICCPGYVITDCHTSQLTNTGAPPPARDRRTFMSARYVATKSLDATVAREPRIVLPALANIPHVLSRVFPRLVDAIITRGVLKTYGDDGTKTLKEIAAEEERKKK